MLCHLTDIHKMTQQLCWNMTIVFCFGTPFSKSPKLSVQRNARRCGGVLHRILQRATFARCRCEVLVRHLEVVFGGDRLAVADPGADNVERVRLGEFRLACRA